MTADELVEQVEHCRAELDAIEREMMDAPETIEVLRPRREVAQAALLQATLRAAAAARPRPLSWHDRERLWQEFCEARIYLRRSTMSVATKARLIAKFGGRNYRQIPW